MKIPQKGFSTLILILIVIILIGIGCGILSRNKNTVNMQVDNSNAVSPALESSRDSMIGIWSSGGSDAGTVRLKLDASGIFSLVEVISYGFSDIADPIPKPKTIAYSGTWNVEKKDNKTYLSLKSNTDFYFFPVTNEQIESDNKWGEEFTGKRTRLLKVGQNLKSDPVFSFRFDGFLLGKNEGVDTQPKEAIKSCPIDGEMAAIKTTLYTFSFLKSINSKDGKPYTKVTINAQNQCDDGRIATEVYKYDLGTYKGTCTELMPSDKDIAGKYPEENVVARVQCLFEGKGSFIEIYEREDFIAHIADIKVPAFKGKLRHLKMVNATDNN